VRAAFPHIRLTVVRERLPAPPSWPLGRCIDFAVALALGLWCL
jgi:hypothetical protein